MGNRLERAKSDYVYVKRTEPAARSALIWLPPEKDVHVGVVRHVGPGYHNKWNTFVPTTVQVGDMVIFTGQGTHEAHIDGENLVVMHEGLIMLSFELEPGDRTYVPPKAAGDSAAAE